MFKVPITQKKNHKTSNLEKMLKIQKWYKKVPKILKFVYP